MNIIFLTKKISVGGVAIVSIQLANRMAKEGYNVSVFAFMKNFDQLAYNRISPEVKVYFGYGLKNIKKNVSCLKEIFKKEEIDWAVNQWGLRWFNITCIKLASRNRSIKVISFYHNDPNTNSRLIKCENEFVSRHHKVRRLALAWKLSFIKELSAISFRYTYWLSDYFALLSDSYTNNFLDIIRINNRNKTIVIPNPITIDNSGYIYNSQYKEKSIIYIGRLDAIQKRTDRVISVWKELEEKLPDWSFSIVGDGQGMTSLKETIKHFNLQRVTIEGFQDPSSYYKKASILLLFSEFEGFPLVLAECMSYGVVPIVLDSFSSVHDIIDSGKDGIVLPYNRSEGFNVSAAANVVWNLVQDQRKLEMMAKCAIKKSENYSEDTIFRLWDSLLNK